LEDRDRIKFDDDIARHLAKYGLRPSDPPEQQQLVLQDWREEDLIQIGAARAKCKKYQDKKLMKLILLYEIGHCYYVYRLDYWTCMEMFKVSREFFKYGCKLYKSGAIVPMIGRRKSELDYRSGEVVVDGEKLENVNFHFKTNMVYGPKLLELIARMTLDPNRDILTREDIVKTWQKMYPDLKVPSPSTVASYCKARLKLSYKHRRKEPVSRNSQDQLNRRLKLISDLYPRFANPDIDVVWYDQKGFRTLDSNTMRWMRRGTNTHPVKSTVRIDNITLHLAMTRHRIIAFQWIKETVTHVEVLDFFNEIITRYPGTVREMTREGTLPEDLATRDSILGWTFMLDNCAIHKHPAMKGFFKKYELDIVFNAAYSP